MHIYAYATSQSANLYIVPGPLVAAGDRTMTKAGEDPLSGAALPMREADETHLSITDDKERSPGKRGCGVMMW